MLFRNEYDFLSNMYECEVPFMVKGEKIVFKSAENRFQALKQPTLEVRLYMKDLSPKKAKSEGKKLKLRSDWEDVKLKIMYIVVKRKFENNAHLSEKLKKINIPIVEENYWNDTFWGVCNGKGQNNLGKILERVKNEL